MRHLDSERYSADREAVLQAALQAGVGTVLSIGIGDGPDTMHRAIDLSREYAGRTDVPKIYATAGVHPDEAASVDAAVLDTPEHSAGRARGHRLRRNRPGLLLGHRAARRPASGLHQPDGGGREPSPAHRHPLPRRRTGWYRRHRRMGRHTRPARPALAAELGWAASCTASPAPSITRARAIDFGFLISFAGNITFPKAQAIRDAAQTLPLASMLVETDAPFLTPVPRRGTAQ